MQYQFNLEHFIKKHVTSREESLLLPDFERYKSQLNSQINGKKVLVIGGAGKWTSRRI